MSCLSLPLSVASTKNSCLSRLLRKENLFIYCAGSRQSSCRVLYLSLCLTLTSTQTPTMSICQEWWRWSWRWWLPMVMSTHMQTVAWSVAVTPCQFHCGHLSKSNAPFKPSCRFAILFIYRVMCYVSFAAFHVHWLSSSSVCRSSVVVVRVAGY